MTTSAPSLTESSDVTSTNTNTKTNVTPSVEKLSQAQKNFLQELVKEK